MSVFQGVIVFFKDVGLYDVVLPFILVYTLVFAIMEKTRVLGVEQVGEEKFSRRNLNSMIAFCIAFFVVASAQLVAIISEIMANTVLLLVLIVCFMLLVGSMHKETPEGFELSPGWRATFYTIMFAGILLIFFNALGWLQRGWNYLVMYWDSQFVGMIILILLIAGIMFWVTKSPGGDDKKEKSKT